MCLLFVLLNLVVLFVYVDRYWVVCVLLNNGTDAKIRSVEMARTIGIRHRRKKTREGEARPTMVAVKQGEDIAEYKLEDDTAELDFLMARFPVAWRSVEPDEEIEWFDKDNASNGIRQHHCKWRRYKGEKEVSENHLRQTINKKGLPIVEQLVKVPTDFDGLQQGDSVAMVLGGSGDRFAAALSRRGEEIKAKVFRIPPFIIVEVRGDEEKEDDHITLTGILEKNPDYFRPVCRRDRDLIRVRETFFLRQSALKDRIACEQRLLQSLVGRIFLNEEGYFPEGVIEAQFKELKANDAIFQALLNDEARREKELKKIMHSLDVWQELFSPIEGCGERISAGIVSGIGDVQRFKVSPDYNGADTPEKRKKRKMEAFNKSKARLKAYCGVHVLSGGKYGDRPAEKQFPRRREGEIANWSGIIVRQSLVLLADQFNRRPNSVWGKKLLQYKDALRQKHPDAVEVEVKVKKGERIVTETRKRYTNGHIHKMAQWRTLTRFVEWLYKEWMKIEERRQQENSK